MKFKTTYTILITTWLILCSAVFASANIFSVYVVPGGNNQTWVYTLVNNDTTHYIYPNSLTLSWDPALPTPLFTITNSPRGWYPQINAANPYWVAFATNEPLAGHSLSGFTVMMTYASSPPPMQYTVVYNDFVGIGNTVSESGSIYNGVPEPSSLAVLGFGLPAVILAIKRYRK